MDLPIWLFRDWRGPSREGKPPRAVDDQPVRLACFARINARDAARERKARPEAHQIAQGVDHGDDPGRQAAARAAYGLILSPPFAPLAFWWAETMGPSIRAYSKSGSPANRSKMRSHTPAAAHRLKRWKTLFQLPKSLGRSRHGKPVRTRHSTASKNKRLSRAVTPRSVDLPGNSASFHSWEKPEPSKPGIKHPNPPSRRRRGPPRPISPLRRAGTRRSRRGCGHRGRSRRRRGAAPPRARRARG